MDLLEQQLGAHKGTKPSEIAKADLLRLFYTIEEAHQKLQKHLKDKATLETFLEKCIHAKPVALKTAQDLQDLIETSKTSLRTAKTAAEKPVPKVPKPKLPALPAVPVAPTYSTSDGITFHIQFGGGRVRLPPLAPAKKSAKQTIPKSVRKHVWDHYIGKEFGEAPCYCCRINKIDKAAFEAGHVVPECHGGSATVENLRPICGECNRSMGNMNMNEFCMRHYKHCI